MRRKERINQGRRNILKVGLVAAAASLAGVTYWHLSEDELSLVENISKISLSDASSLDDKTTEAWLNGITWAESEWGKKIVRDKGYGDVSYGIAHFTIPRARQLERRYSGLPRLGDTEDEAINSLMDNDISMQYLKRSYQEGLNKYHDHLLAVAAHNAGLNAPKEARIQQRLNHVLGTKLVCDGDIAAKTKAAIHQFQSKYNESNPNDQIGVDGIYGRQTEPRLEKGWLDWAEKAGYQPEKVLGPRAWNISSDDSFRTILENHPEYQDDPIGRIPNNRITGLYVAKAIEGYLKYNQGQRPGK